MKTLPIRRWLYLSLAILFLFPVFTAVLVGGLTADSPGADLAETLGENVENWDDPAWLDSVEAEYHDAPVEFALFRNGREIYRSSMMLDGSTHDRPWITTQRELEYLDGEHTVQVFHEEFQYPAALLTGAGTFVLTLAGVGWFLGRMVVRPLAATGDAAGRISDGDLDVDLPTSRVREVAEVNEAFAQMSRHLRESLEQRAAMEQDRRFFISSVAHDLRTPLFSLRGYLEGLQQGVAGTPERRAEYLDLAQEKANALDRLIADLSDFTRLEYLDQTPNQEPLDLAQLLIRLVDGMRPQADLKAVAMTIDRHLDSCMVRGDHHLLGRAIENLLDNALRHTPAGGEIRVECRLDASWIEFSVTDTGTGIADKDLPHIFSPLYRGEVSRNRRTGGTGLGLTIAQGIVHAHDGELTARNAENGGAIFSVRLPALNPGGK